PRLASLSTDGKLYLNLGPKASDRVFGDITDGDENFTVAHTGGTAGDETVQVTAFGITQTYNHVSQLVADGGNGNDSITVIGFLGPLTISGGAGDDNIDVSTSSGAATLDG